MRYPLLLVLLHFTRQAPAGYTRTVITASVMTYCNSLNPDGSCASCSNNWCAPWVHARSFLDLQGANVCHVRPLCRYLDQQDNRCLPSSSACPTQIGWSNGGNNTCADVVAGCSSYSTSNGLCTACQDSLSLATNGSSCLLPANSVPNCLLGSGSTCSVCAQGYSGPSCSRASPPPVVRVIGIRALIHSYVCEDQVRAARWDRGCRRDGLPSALCVCIATTAPFLP